MHELVALVPLVAALGRGDLGYRAEVIPWPLKHLVPALIQCRDRFVRHFRCSNDPRYACAGDADELSEPRLANSVLLRDGERLVLRQLKLGDLTQQRRLVLAEFPYPAGEGFLLRCQCGSSL